MQTPDASETVRPGGAPEEPRPVDLAPDDVVRDEPVQDDPQRGPGRWWLGLHLLALVVAGVVLLRVNRRQWFFGDEWEFLVNRGFVDPALSIWQPHNEHWSTLPIAVYSVLRDTVGLGSYWPYITVLVLVHLALTHALWRVLLRVGLAPLLATALAAAFSVLGAGYENLLWAFQIGFIGSIAFGWAALLVATAPGRSRRLGRRDAAAALLLVASLMCSGIGVPMVVVATIGLWGTVRTLRPPLVVGGAPTAVFLVWYVTIGRRPAADTGADHSPLAVFRLVRDGLTGMIRTIGGTPDWLAVLLLVGLVVWSAVAVWVVARGTGPAVRWAPALAGVTGLLVLCVMIALGRNGLSSSRYLYVGTALALPAVGAVLAALPRRWWVHGPVVLLIAWVGWQNLTLLRTMSSAEGGREEWIREVVDSAAVLIDSGERDFVGQLPEPVYDPDISVEALQRLVDDGVLPLGEATVRGTAAVRLALGVAVIPPGSGPASSPADELTVVAMEPSSADEACLVPTGAGPDSSVVLAPSGDVESLWLSAEDTAVTFSFTLGTGADAPPARTVTVQRGSVVELLTLLPQDAGDLTVVPSSADGLVCTAAP
jgi:hypothetical protein